MLSFLGYFYNFDKKTPEKICSSKIDNDGKPSDKMEWILNIFYYKVKKYAEGLGINEKIINENLDFFDLLFNMLQLKQEDRFTIDQVIRHPFFTS